MSTSPVHDNTAAELDRINAALGALLGAAPVPLVHGADRAMHDPLVICGILGGKDVGKSTLINALAERAVSVDAEEVGAGTSRPMAYVHREVVDTARARFRAGGEGRDLGDLDVTIHDADAIRDAVIVDLPDFDSEFPQHVEIVRHVAPRLDRVMWVVTARKMADRAWVAFCRHVVKDVRNVHFVVNKADELVTDDLCWREGESGDGRDPHRRAAAFWRAQQEWAARGLTTTGCAVARDGQFMVAARYPNAEAFVTRVSEAWGDPQWEQYADDRGAVGEVGRLASDELGRLRATVLQPVNSADAQTLKQANQVAEAQANGARIREHHDLERQTERLQRACDPAYLQAVLGEAFGPTYCQAAAGALARDRVPDTLLANEVMGTRVEQWPILRAVYWPLSWVVQRAGRALVTSASGPAKGPDAKPLAEVGGRTTAERVATVLAGIRQDHAAAIRSFRLQEALPEPKALAMQLEARLADIVPALDRQIVADVSESGRRPGLLRRSLVWLALLWFPFVQPVTEGLLQIVGGPGSLDLLGGLYKVVWALGAGQLLKGFAVVVAVYVACLAAMYARCVRDVRRARKREPTGETDLSDAIEAALVDEVAAPVSHPFVTAAATLASLTTRLDRLTSAQS